MRPTRLALALALAVLVSCKGSDDEAPIDAERSGVAAGSEPARVESFIAAPDYATLTALLGQGHAIAREQLGPHRLRYTATMTTGPAGLAADQPLPDVAAGQPIHERFAVTDTLELVWASRPGEPPRLALDQRNEHEHGRALVLIDEREWANLDGRGWFERPVETDLWQLWADDAQHAVLDLVELAGPDAEIAAVEIEDAGRPAVRVSLRASEERHPERIVDGTTSWRRDAEVSVVEATILLDRATGLWRHASIELDWTFRDSARRELVGHAQLLGTVDVLAEPPAVNPPTEQAPLPERDRPELLRERLLDGLAGP